ncbi:MAG: terminase small subunit [Acidobacteria bacterium]|nr:terminase small subunit [Acidobacteriota bacterium]
MPRTKSKSRQLTARQELFAQHFALAGNGTRAALASGCRNYGTARERASRWLANPNIRARVSQIRQKALNDAKKKLLATLEEFFMDAFYTRPWRDVRRGLALVKRVGMFEGDAARVSHSSEKISADAKREGADAR